jgi:hypothetical protein
MDRPGRDMQQGRRRSPMNQRGRSPGNRGRSPPRGLDRGRYGDRDRWHRSRSPRGRDQRNKSRR